MLLTQLENTLPPVYLRPYGNKNSGKATTNIRVLLQQLLQIYCSVSNEKLDKKELNLGPRVLLITQPPVYIFEAVKDLNKIATASNKLSIESQLIATGLYLTKNTIKMENF